MRLRSGRRFPQRGEGLVWVNSVIAVAVTILQGSAVAQQDADAQEAALGAKFQQGHAVIWIAAESEGSNQLAMHRASAGELRSQLLLSGYPAEQIVLLDGADADQLQQQLQTVADASKPDQTILVFLMGTGVCIDGRDGLQNPEGAESPMVSIQSVLEILQTSACVQQTVICDGWRQESPQTPAAGYQDFGTGALTLSDGQAAIVSRMAGLDGQQTRFMSAVRDALTELADQNKDQTISITELNEYLLNYAATYGLSQPLSLFGNLASEIAVAKAATLEEVGRMTSEVRADLAWTQIQNAYQQLLLENNSEAARIALQRAISLRPDERMLAELKGLWLTSLCSDPDGVRLAFAEAQKDQRPLFLLLKSETAGTGNVDKQAPPLVVQITDVNGQQVAIAQAWQPSLGPSVMKFEKSQSLPVLTLESLSSRLFLTGSLRDSGNTDEKLRLVALLQMLVDEN